MATPRVFCQFLIWSETTHENHLFDIDLTKILCDQYGAHLLASICGNPLMFKLDVVVILRLINMKAVVLNLTMFDNNVNVCIEKGKNEILYGNWTFIYRGRQT